MSLDFFGRLYLNRLLGVLPLKFLHALEIDQALLAYTLSATGSSQKRLIVKIWLKIQRVRAYKFGASGSILMKLFQATCREAEVITYGGTTFGRPTEQSPHVLSVVFGSCNIIHV